jgi:DNA-binding NtrC family response regulator
MTSPQQIHEKRRVLIVDDDEKIRDMLCHYLGLHGFEAHAADNGISAIRLLSDSQQGFDIVITDYDMPEMGGIELVRNIRRRFAPETIIGMSGMNTTEKDFMNVGAHAFFPKPLELQDVLESLRPSPGSAQGGHSPQTIR